MAIPEEEIEKVKSEISLAEVVRSRGEEQRRKDGSFGACVHSTPKMNRASPLMKEKAYGTAWGNVRRAAMSLAS